MVILQHNQIASKAQFSENFSSSMFPSSTLNPKFILAEPLMILYCFLFCFGLVLVPSTLWTTDSNFY